MIEREREREDERADLKSLSIVEGYFFIPFFASSLLERKESLSLKIMSRKFCVCVYVLPLPIP